MSLKLRTLDFGYADLEPLRRCKPGNGPKDEVTGRTRRWHSLDDETERKEWKADLDRSEDYYNARVLGLYRQKVD